MNKNETKTPEYMKIALRLAASCAALDAVADGLEEREPQTPATRESARMTLRTVRKAVSDAQGHINREGLKANDVDEDIEACKWCGAIQSIPGEEIHTRDCQEAS